MCFIALNYAAICTLSATVKKNLSFARSLINLSNKMWLDLSSRAVEAADLTPSHFTKIYKQQERKIIIYLLRLLYYFFVNVVHKQAKKHFTDSKKFKFNEAKNIPKKESTDLCNETT